ncbi:hypothetical protein BDR07DRAFT_149601 [Suillus spraguei]|nr:hypothetical protein BDR07DRAFT_149601 [Suillus spraguei]
MDRPWRALFLCGVLAGSTPCCAWGAYPSTPNRWTNMKCTLHYVVLSIFSLNFGALFRQSHFHYGRRVYRCISPAYLRKAVLLRLVIIYMEFFFVGLWRVETIRET